MLELIDQSNPMQLRYRCILCHAVGISTPAMVPDNAFLVLTPGGPKTTAYVRHQCAPQPYLPPPPAAVDEDAPKPKRKYTRRKVDATPE